MSNPIARVSKTTAMLQPEAQKEGVLTLHACADGRGRAHARAARAPGRVACCVLQAEVFAPS